MLWKPVVGYEGFYSVSEDGQIRRDKACAGATVGRILKWGQGPYPNI